MTIHTIRIDGVGAMQIDVDTLQAPEDATIFATMSTLLMALNGEPHATQRLETILHRPRTRPAVLTVWAYLCYQELIARGHEVPSDHETEATLQINHLPIYISAEARAREMAAPSTPPDPAQPDKPTSQFRIAQNENGAIIVADGGADIPSSILVDMLLLMGPVLAHVPAATEKLLTTLGETNYCYTICKAFAITIARVLEARGDLQPADETTIATLREEPNAHYFPPEEGNSPV